MAISSCKTCHDGYHKGTVKIPSSIHRGIKFKDAVFMGIMKKTLLKRVKEIYEPRDIEVENTYGYITN